MNMTTPFNFDPFFSRTIGFEQIFERLNTIAEEKTGSVGAYPPYNINRLSDGKFDIEIAVAGFTEEDLDVELKDGTLTVQGKKEDKKNKNYLHRGIANRSFRRIFHLEDYTEPTGANIENGLLTIHLEKIIPDELKPKKINIKSGMQEEQTGTGAQLLNESTK
jgi:molecular chaperone IbpA